VKVAAKAPRKRGTKTKSETQPKASNPATTPKTEMTLESSPVVSKKRKSVQAKPAITDPEKEATSPEETRSKKKRKSATAPTAEA